MLADDLLDFAKMGGASNSSVADILWVYYLRPWSGGPCTMDDVIALSSQHDVDPSPLIHMLWACGELPQDEP